MSLVRYTPFDELFNRFAQIHDTRNDAVAGTGLGLPITRDLARAGKLLRIDILHSRLLQQKREAEGALSVALEPA